MIPKTLSRLSRSALVSLATKWLSNPTLFRPPYLACNRDALEAEEEDYLYEPADDVGSLRAIYEDLKDDPATTRRDIVERMVEGDWRRGLGLHQLAMIDVQHLLENEASLRWSALRIVPAAEEGRDGDGQDETQLSKRRKMDDGLGRTTQQQFPRIQPATFLKALKAEVSPLVKAHYYLHRLPKPYDLTVIRIYLTGVPFNDGRRTTGQHATDGARALYLALPNSCPYVYVAISGASSGPPAKRSTDKSKSAAAAAKLDVAAMKRIVLEAVPKALSRPQRRYAMESTDLSARSLKTICAMRGNGRVENCAGVFGSFAAAEADATPLEARVDKEQQGNGGGERGGDLNEEESDRFARVQLRFGPEIKDVAFDRFSVRIQDIGTSPRTRKRKRGGKGSLPGVEEKPVSLNLAGADVFTGLRKLAELDGAHVNLDSMPAWMTGERGVSTLAV